MRNSPTLLAEPSGWKEPATFLGFLGALWTLRRYTHLKRNIMVSAIVALVAGLVCQQTDPRITPTFFIDRMGTWIGAVVWVAVQWWGPLVIVVGGTFVSCAIALPVLYQLLHGVVLMTSSWSVEHDGWLSRRLGTHPVDGRVTLVSREGELLVAAPGLMLVLHEVVHAVRTHRALARTSESRFDWHLFFAYFVARWSLATPGMPRERRFELEALASAAEHRLEAAWLARRRARPTSFATRHDWWYQHIYLPTSGGRGGPRFRRDVLIGRGATGEVWKGTDLAKDRTIALKTLITDIDVTGERLNRFKQEAAITARLNEPHVIPVHDYGEIDGELFIDMRFVEGGDLRQALVGHGALDPRRAVHIVSQIASALDAAHAAGLVHRDVKPANVLVQGGIQTLGEDFVYLTDFGIARVLAEPRLTAEGIGLGTVPYVAPEQIGGDGDHRVDIYALGCVLFECLTNRQPFIGDRESVLRQHIVAVPPRPSDFVTGVPTALDDVIARALAKNAKDRFASAGDLARAARAALG